MIIHTPIRQPIVTIAGHVDHGKTSILDRIRGSYVAKQEAGGITQKISFTSFPSSNIRKSCCLIDKYNMELKIPGFLFIDTPGHQAFTNLRKRGGSLADLAILVISITEGIKPQTQEVLQILKANKTPFIVALNKIDQISGWSSSSKEIKDSLEAQQEHVKNSFNEKIYTIIGSLNSWGFEADLYHNIKDFTKKLALVPCSAKTGEGIQELIMMLCGLSQKYLSNKLNLAEDAKGVILEIKKEKSSQYAEAILYDGRLKIGEEIAIASFNSPIISKIRVLEEIQPLSNKFKPEKEVMASSGIRLQLTETKEILPGMPFMLYKGNIDKIEKEFKKEINESIQLDEQGIIIKADSLGSLEALSILLRQANIPILKAGIGKISKQDIINAKANEETNPINSIILGFNVEIDEEAKQMEKDVKILKNEVIYKLIEDCQKYRQEKQSEIEKNKLLELTSICKLELLKNYVFRNSKPAIFGVKVQGKLKPGIKLIDDKGEEIDKVKNIQLEKESVQEASNQEVAISLPNTTYDRQLKESRFLYSDLNEFQFRKFKENKELLSSEEKKILQEIAAIKRKTKLTWGV